MRSSAYRRAYRAGAGARLEQVHHRRHHPEPARIAGSRAAQTAAGRRAAVGRDRVPAIHSGFVVPSSIPRAPGHGRYVTVTGAPGESPRLLDSPRAANIVAAGDHFARRPDDPDLGESPDVPSRSLPRRAASSRSQRSTSCATRARDQSRPPGAPAEPIAGRGLRPAEPIAADNAEAAALHGIRTARQPFGATSETSVPATTATPPPRPARATSSFATNMIMAVVGTSPLLLFGRRKDRNELQKHRSLRASAAATPPTARARPTRRRLVVDINSSQPRACYQR